MFNGLTFIIIETNKWTAGQLLDKVEESLAGRMNKYDSNFTFVQSLIRM